MLKNIVISERLRNVIIAVALAAFAGMLTLFYVSNYKRHVQQGEENVSVLVATHDIPAGTPGDEVLKDHLVETRQLAQKGVVPGTFSEPTQVEKLITTDHIYAGEQITASRFKPQAQRGVRADLKGTMRAIQIPGDPNQLMAGTLSAGDHVDVVASVEYKLPNRGAGGGDLDRVASRVVLRDILVLKAPAGSGVGSAVTHRDGDAFAQLALTDNQAQKLFYVMKNGEWSLILRPPVRSADSPESVEVVETVLGDGLRPRQYQQLAGRGIR
jgi:Flp pilus assembly protein CpaB